LQIEIYLSQLLQLLFEWFVVGVFIMKGNGKFLYPENQEISLRPVHNKKPEQESEQQEEAG